MQPAQSGATGGAGAGGNRQLKRWGPIAAVVAVVAIGAVVLVATGRDDGGDTSSSVAPAAATSAPATSTAGSTDTAAADAATTTEPGETSTYPLSFSQATELGVADQIDWGKRCDTTIGRVAVPDFFAPECFAPFSGDNGGATDEGVTGDEIVLVNYLGQAGDPVIRYITDAVAVDDTNEQMADTMQGLVDYYQAYYELYGRTIKLINFEGTGIATDPVAARADAALVAEQYKPFAVLGGPALTSAFGDELAAKGILCIGCTPGQPNEFYAERDPLVWSLGTSAAQAQTHVIEFITKQLVGKNAEFGGDAVKAQPRTFGYLYLDSSGASKDLADQFSAAMSDAGAPFAETVVYALDPATIQATASQAIAKMKSAGVTSIVFSGDPVAPRDFTREATAQEYFPEWVLAGSTLVDTNAFSRSYDQQQWRHAFGPTFGAARTDTQTIGSYAVYRWFHGEDPPAPGRIAVLAPNPALFFSVLQGAGPNLTHETWRDALFNGSGTRQAVSQPYLSYGDKGLWDYPDYHGVDDGTLIWWDPDATGPDELRKDGPGMWQFVDGGARFLPGEWPTDSRLFDPTGAVTIYTTPPPGEEPNQYPSPAG
ncbi:MAG: hypothetical protein WEB78_04035 [Ilumatobacteraceae bacterium]